MQCCSHKGIAGSMQLQSVSSDCALLLLLLMLLESCPAVKCANGIVVQARVVCRLTKSMVLSRMERGKPQIGLSPHLSSPDNSSSSMSVPPQCMLCCECMLCCRCMLCCAVNACCVYKFLHRHAVIADPLIAVHHWCVQS